MFYAKEEKANFKLENESQPNVRHFLTDIINKVTNRKPYVNIFSENNIGSIRLILDLTTYVWKLCVYLPCVW